MPDMGDLGGTIEANAGGPGGPGGTSVGADIGNNNNDGGGANAGGSPVGSTATVAGVTLETISAIGLAGVAITTAVTGAPMLAASAVFATIGAIGFVIDNNGVIIGDANAISGPSATAVGTAAILGAYGVTLNATQAESLGTYDAMGGTETVAINDIVAGANVFDPIGAENNATLNAFLVSIPFVDQIVQNTAPGMAIIATASGALGIDGAAAGEVFADYGAADAGKLNIWLPDGDLVTFTPDLQNMVVMRAADWSSAYTNELKPDGFPSTVAALMYDRAVQHPVTGATQTGGGNG